MDSQTARQSFHVKVAWLLAKIIQPYEPAASHETRGSHEVTALTRLILGQNCWSCPLRLPDSLSVCSPHSRLALLLHPPDYPDSPDWAIALTILL